LFLSAALITSFIFALTGQVEREVKAFDLSQASFNPEVAIATAKQQGAKAIVLVPDVGSSPYGLANALKVIKSPHSRDLLLILSESLYNYQIPYQAAGNRHLFVNLWNIPQNQSTEFLRTAKALWQQETVAWETTGTYDATLVIIAALQQQPSRAGVQKVLSNKNFRITGATGVIEFDKGDRKENPSISGYVLVKVVPKCAGGGYGFLPANQGLKCS
jgi:eukaryotic-like serine/threonine-protein kinase